MEGEREGKVASLTCWMSAWAPTSIARTTVKANIFIWFWGGEKEEVKGDAAKTRSRVVHRAAPTGRCNHNNVARHADTAH